MGLEQSAAIKTEHESEGLLARDGGGGGDKGAARGPRFETCSNTFSHPRVFEPCFHTFFASFNRELFATFFQAVRYPPFYLDSDIIRS